MRRLARTLGTLMIVAGVLMLAWAFTVWRWEDPFTALLNRVDQRELSQNLERRFDSFVPAPEPTAPATASSHRSSLPQSAAKWERSSKQGDAVARLRIPRLGLKSVVVNGTDHNSLKRGPGRYLKSGMPGEGELVYIAGHRTTYGAPFARIDRLERGDKVFLELPYGTFEYVVTGHRIVTASKTSELKSRGFEQLALQACHPRFFASERYIVYARPVRVTSTSGDLIPLARGSS
jgi:sortase A